ncbi:tax1-binding protein 1 isoform X1 [Pongo pygmaeus]|uniref:tax1-binding protein 1 isoform X1 n=1 Tax=Pongo pygmaeus TaxID=9600 RepID=UPI0023E16403|nr:tax1-binding protein 1 isoform X1 [Pongo pygmaeus]XP_054351686.1 tax1-binding protein 1 isoform X1 [Pongo pygmaeus]XP_054351688.1 tax1-binding protein 1 isoform X1 [Pongo pygmaeus]XP_054351689.1 tax1-binding protein 1 isoform X1 [Pongo pygmaeus]XP_054351690.1 tax1-binding protein 1 isoform X1 [Pongo pygmaeus]XP_054351691.1 tax1-binding protein 1 isoform X1 [Pongo pygmaeus]XP_054351692.1 tax1-binding protein 1 isoform X1 [Pongo pygmaeus]XP_054351693.1 tax1-binding protein 1 isoform X1 [Pon
MTSFQEVPLQTSNFAHVIFQNVAKSYLPNAHLECHYTLTPYIHPHPKDWVGIFKVGWSTARDYYTFLWSPMPEHYVEGSTVNCVLAFQGYYLPNDDGEFYQFCYVTHKGEIRGASTPFQFRASSPVEELLTMEDEGNSDMLVVTTKAGLLELKIEKTMKEKEELLKLIAVLEKETAQLREQVGRMERELNHEKERCDQLQAEQKGLTEVTQSLKMENEEFKKRFSDATSKAHQLEEDIVSVTHKAIEKETELDSLKDKLKKAQHEREQLECQLKTEKDEKELYKVHLKNTEIENTKLMSEVQTLKNLDGNKESVITHFKEEIGRLQLCLAEKENLQRTFLLTTSSKEDTFFLKEQLRKAEEQVQATRQEVVFLAKELSDAVNVRDRTMADLHTARLENEKVKKQLADAVAELKLNAMKKDQDKTDTLEHELRREVEDLKLRLQMAADHYKEKFKECQRLQKQINKLSDQSANNNNVFTKKMGNQQKVNDASVNTDPATSASTVDVKPSPSAAEADFDIVTKGQVCEMTKEIADKTEKYNKCKQLLQDEKAKCNKYADELAKMELKWKEQVKIAENVKLELAEVQDNYKLQLAEKDKEISGLISHLENLSREKELKRSLENQAERKMEGQNSQSPQCLKTCSEQNGYVLTLSNAQPVLQYGNPYASQETRDGADGAFYPDEIQRPPVRVPSWGLEDNVVCSQPARNLSRPDGLEDSEDSKEDENAPTAPDPPSQHLRGHGTGFCFDSSFDVHKKCPLCELMFPPNYDQSKFEEHVESHWKVCPMCSEQFPPDYDQQVFERHVQTHFDQNVLNFD